MNKSSVYQKLSMFYVSAQMLCIAVVLIGPLLEKFSNTSIYNFDFLWIKIFSAILFISALIFFLGAIGRLGKTLTPSPIPKDSGVLVTHGLYAFCRHPIYTGLISMAIGFSFFFSSWISFLSTLILILVLRSKASFEERLLKLRFGKIYEEYIERVGRFMPFLF